MASVVGEREIDLSKLSIEQLNQLKTQLSEVREEGGREGGRIEALCQLLLLNDKVVDVCVDALYSVAYIYALPSRLYIP